MEDWQKTIDGLTEEQATYGMEYVDAMAWGLDLPDACPLNPMEERELWEAVGRALSAVRQRHVLQRFGGRRCPEEE